MRSDLRRRRSACARGQIPGQDQVEDEVRGETEWHALLVARLVPFAAHPTRCEQAVLDEPEADALIEGLTMLALVQTLDIRHVTLTLSGASV